MEEAPFVGRVGVCVPLAFADAALEAMGFEGVLGAAAGGPTGMPPD